MHEEFYNHKRTDTIKWILTLIAFVLVGVILAGIILGWFTKTEDKDKTEKPATTVATEGAMLATTNDSNVRMQIRKLNADEFANYDVKAADSAYTLTATVMPENATNKRVSLSFDWVNPNSTWATGKAVGQYFSCTSNGENSWTLAVAKPFGEQIRITVKAPNYVDGDTSAANLALKATCTVDYVKRVQSVSLTYTGKNSRMQFGSSTTVSYSVRYSDGTLQGTFTAGHVALKLSDGLYSACCNALTSGTWQKTQTLRTFADLTNATSQTVDVGACTRFIVATGNPGSGAAQWQSAFRTFINSTPQPHGTLEMAWSYSYQGKAAQSGTATGNVLFDPDTLLVDASSVSLSQQNIVF